MSGIEVTIVSVADGVNLGAGAGGSTSTTGLSTSAKQDIGNASLTSIDAKQDTTNAKLDTVITNTTNLSISALQTAGNASLTNIDADLGAKNDTPATDDTGIWSLLAMTKRTLQNWTTFLARVPTLGQKVATGSSPVVIASDQSAVKVQNEFYEASATITSTTTTVTQDLIPSFDASKYSELLVQVAYINGQSSYAGTIAVQGSNDNVNFTPIPVTNIGYTGNPTMNNAPLLAIYSGVGGYKAPVNYRYIKVVLSGLTAITGSGGVKVMLLAKTQPSSNATMGVSTIHKTYATSSNTLIALANVAQNLSTNSNRAGVMIQNTDSNPATNWVRVCFSNSYSASATVGILLNSNRELTFPANLSSQTIISIFSPTAGTSVAFCEFSY